MSLFQYIKDTRGELHHVAWPTRAQTIIYTSLVIGLSITIALYLGFFDYIFTTGLGRTVQLLPDRTLIIDPGSSTASSSAATE